MHKNLLLLSPVVYRGSGKRGITPPPPWANDILANSFNIMHKTNIYSFMRFDCQASIMSPPMPPGKNYLYASSRDRREEQTGACSEIKVGGGCKSGNSLGWGGKQTAKGTKTLEVKLECILVLL